ncbi:MAG: cell envelope integrity protein TolA [Pseudomonadota bacterium]
MREDTVKSGRLPAAILAVLVHLLFIGFLIFSVNWRSHPPPPVMADLWEALPPPKVKPVVTPQPTPKPKPKPQPVVEPEPPQPKPDIALKEKKRKEQQLREQQAQLEQQKQLEAQQRKQQQLQQKKQEAEQRKLAEQEKQQQEKLAQEKQKQQEEKRKQDDLKRKQEALRKLNMQQSRDFMNKELASETSRLQQAQQASQLGAEQAKMEATYKERIRSKIASMLRLPENMIGNPKAVFAVTVLPTGEVAQVRLVTPSGQPAYDTAVERAILGAVPLPLPPDKAVAARFHDLTLPIQPKQEN